MMDDDRLSRAIRRAFERYEPSRAAGPAATRRQGVGPGALASRRVPRFALSLVALAGAAVLAVTLAPARPTFASWRAAPSTVDTALVASAFDDCTGSDPDHLAGLRLVGSEQRGDYTMLLFGDGRAYGLCLTGGDVEPMVLAGPGSSAVDAPGGPSGDDDPVGDDGPMPGIAWVAQPASGERLASRVEAWVIGITPEAKRVVIERAAGEPVVATVAEGVAFAWSPTGSEALAIAAYDAAGNVLQRIAVDTFGSH